ncbi:MAG: ArsA family ATPase [Polyangiaceae bacterium]|nr:ArsA family ATPase [Polyangiaceae bacterium]
MLGNALEASTADTFASLSKRRLLLVTGKGGVGKTSMTAAIALSLAKRGKRVFVGEVATEGETSSPLALAFGSRIVPNEPEEVSPGVCVGLIHPSRGHQKFLRDVLKVKLLADSAMKSTPIRKFLATAPAFPEMGVLYRILELLGEKSSKHGPNVYDHVLVDLPATGHALALAQVPETLLKVFSAGPIVEAVRRGLDILTDPEQTGGLIVTLPETLPVSESIELAVGVSAKNIPIAAMILNRVPTDPFTVDERDALRNYSKTVSSVLGLRTVAKMDRSDAALARLRASTSFPVAVVPDFFVEPELLPTRLSTFIFGSP